MPQGERILVVDDEESMRHMLQVLLTKHGYRVTTAGDGEAALLALENATFDTVLSDVRMPRLDGLTLLASIRDRPDAPTVILMSAYGTLDLAVEAMAQGAYDYINKPFHADEVVLTLRKAEERRRLQRENRALRTAVRREVGFENIVATSDAMARVFDTVRKVANYKTTVLLQGESGTGKELVARALHFHSTRADAPFVAINCGAIAETLLESELFGHVKGAFTDTTRDKRGLFQEADGGTLFLDEVGEMPAPLQVKLLRVIQEGELRRVGDTRTIQIDVRLVAASARNLSDAVAEGLFREDLFYRLNVLPLGLPALRERKDDIPVLVEHFLGRFNERLQREVQGVTPQAMGLLMAHGWPGNVRELENAIEHAIILSDGPFIDVDALPKKVRDASDPIRLALGDDDLSIKRMVRVVEEELIRRALAETDGNRARAAELLEISQRSLQYKLKEYEVDA